MQVEIIKETGFDEAMLGLSLNKNQPVKNMEKVSDKLAFLGNGHNKFLRFLIVYLDINAPRFWWSEFDTYKVNVTASSSSTMHTLHKNTLTRLNFEYEISCQYLNYLNSLINDYNKGLINIDVVKGYLPEGFLQRRIVVTNYAQLQNIFQQRRSHRLPQWCVFCDELKNLKYYKWIDKNYKGD